MQAILTEIDRKAISELKFFSSQYESEFNRAIAINNNIIDKIRANEIKTENYFTSPYVTNKWRVEARKLYDNYISKFGIDEYVPANLKQFVIDELADELKEMYQEYVLRRI